HCGGDHHPRRKGRHRTRPRASVRRVGWRGVPGLHGGRAAHVFGSDSAIAERPRPYRQGIPRIRAFQPAMERTARSPEHRTPSHRRCRSYVFHGALAWRSRNPDARLAAPDARSGAPMKRVLMVAFHFPPLAGSSGIQRTLRFARHLPQFGWQPMILTAHPRAYERTSDDQTGDTDSIAIVERAFALDSARHLAFRGRYPAFVARPDRWIT